MPERRSGATDSWSALVAVYQSVLHDIVGALERDAGLDSGVFSALAYLERAEPAGRMRLSDLQTLMHPRYSQPGLSRLVQRMAADGLITRRADPADRRAVTLSITAKGRARYRRADEVYTAAVREHFARHLTAPERARLTAVLTMFLERRGPAAS